VRVRHLTLLALESGGEHAQRVGDRGVTRLHLWVSCTLSTVTFVFFKFRNNAQFAAQLAASISHVALIGL
jgi:hypothetical protein